MKVWRIERMIVVPTALFAAACAAPGPDEGPLAAARAALTVTEDQKLTEETPALQRVFGFTVAGSGDTALIGAPDENSLTRGAAHVYTVTGGAATLDATLVPSDGENGMAFGRQVALDGDTAAVMASANYEVRPYEERVYVFVRSEGAWSEQAKLTVPEDPALSFSRMAVDVGGDTVVASTVGEDIDIVLGKAFAFTRTGNAWSPRVELVPQDSPRGFGWSVAVSGDTAIVGAAADSPEGSEFAGSAYVFVRDGGSWTQQAKLVPHDMSARASFGFSVDLAGDTAAIGAKSAVYVYTRSGGTWTEQAKLVPALRGSEATGVQLLGNAVIAGFVGVADNKGIVSVFHGGEGTWTEARTLAPSDGQTLDFFGWSTGYAGESVVVGAPYHSAPLNRSGGAYVYALPSLDGAACVADADCLSGSCEAGQCAPGGGSGASSSVAGGGGSGGEAGSGGASSTVAGGGGSGGEAGGGGASSTVAGSGGSGGEAGGGGGASSSVAGGGVNAGSSTASSGTGGPRTDASGGGGCRIGGPGQPTRSASTFMAFALALAVLPARRLRDARRRRQAARDTALSTSPAWRRRRPRRSRRSGWRASRPCPPARRIRRTRPPRRRSGWAGCSSTILTCPGTTTSPAPRATRSRPGAWITGSYRGGARVSSPRETR
ncbi:hypothetical protein WMF45_38345 [Sorangium sp. So ce448]|uniref:FG-GAP repeat protein n=1 Tax=Sorangium sp. So ce448 TaxID=3133314 RepID=UPI003F5EA993